MILRCNYPSKFCITIFILCLFILITACRNAAPESTEEPETEFLIAPMRYPVWVRTANIYEVNLRQYTPEGTIDAFRRHIPRLADMGVSVLWFMPIYPIGFEKRKGSLGSYYSISDYTDVNPEFGTLQEFKALVDEIHQAGMYVILDWVANHTAWDHSWISSNPDWYSKKEDTITHALWNDGTPTDWYDVADLDFSVIPMRNTMIQSMKFWVRETNIDGFRCDAAHLVPDEFWAEVRPELESIKPVFMLAEAEDRPNHFETCFQANYGWTFHTLLNDIAQGNAGPADIDTYLEQDRSSFPYGYFHINFITNHDENSWAGSIPERMGEAAQAMAVLAHTLEGAPLIYSGEESRLNKRLRFFDKDTIDWKDYPLQDFYSKLLYLKKYNQALWNGSEGSMARRINDSDQVYAFKREKNGQIVLVIVNCSDQPATTVLDEQTRPMHDLFTDVEYYWSEGEQVELRPWEYLVLGHPSIIL